MKVQIVTLIVVLALLLAGSVAMAQSSGQGLPVLYTVRQGVMAGEGYHLASLTWQVSGAASGTGHRLASSSSPAGTGTQCCCSYLPCMLRNYP
jgi:hypothetical protein